MLGSSQLDLLIGLDIHIEMVPPGVPTPFPHPFLGMIEYTPFGTLISLGMAKAVSCVTGAPPQGPVLINGFPATKTGDEGQNKKLLPHFVIPPGSAWAPIPKLPRPKAKPGPPGPPGNPATPPGDAIMVTGSATVYSEGSNQCRLGDLAMSCSDPVRLPSSVLLPIPKGAPVLVGGPPKFDWSTAAKAFFLRNKWAAGLLHSLISRLPPGRLRNLLHKAACFMTGHPVDVATGRLLTDATDFELLGPIPLTFERNYASSWANRDSTLGYGWSHSFDERIWIERGKVVYKAGDGREIEFQCYHLPGRYMREGQEIFYPIDRLTLRCEGNGLWSIRTPDGLVREFEHVAGVDGHVSMIRRIKDPVGHWIQFDYANGYLEGVTTSEERWVRFEHHDGLLQRVAVQLGDGPADGWYNQVRFSYSPERDLTAATDASNRSRTYKYDQHLLIEERDRDGVTFWFEYDGRDHSAFCVRTWGSDGKGCDRLYFREITYDKKNNRTFVEDSLGHMTIYTMNPANAVVEVTDPFGAKTKYEYNEHLWVTAEVDALGNATRCAFDARGNETERVLPNGAKLLVEYNAQDQPVRMLDPIGVEWRWHYDRLGRVLIRSNNLGHAVRFEYEGRVLRTVTRTDGTTLRFDHDGAENVSAVTLPGGAVERRFHDRQGRVTKIVNAVGHVQRFTYDWESRIVQMEETGGLWRRVELSGEGDLLEYSDNLRRVQFGYRGNHRLAWRTEANESVEFRYSSEDQIVEVQNEGGEVYAFEWDPCGRVVKERGFEGRTHSFRHDLLGRIVVRTRPDGETETYTYDVMGNIAGVKYPDGTEEAFSYNGVGELVSATNNAGTITWERDAKNRTITESFGGDWVTSHYDLLGSRVQVATSRGLREAIARTETSDVRRIEIFEAPAGGGPRRRTWALDIERDAVGREIRRTMPNGLSTIAYSDQGRVQRRELFRGKDLLTRTDFTWEGDDRLRRRVDHGLGTTEYAHDARGRLDAIRFPDLSMQFRTPNPDGTIFKARDRNDRRYGAAGILMESDGSKFLYDPNGNLIEREYPDGKKWQYTWNGAGLLASVTRPDGMQVEFVYDALGRRVKKTVRAKEEQTVTEWLWDGDVPVHEWVDANADQAADKLITWLIDQDTLAPLAKVERKRGQAVPDKYSIITDYLGTPEEMLNEAGEIAWRAQLDAYGIPRMSEGQRQDLPWRRPGQYEDIETGLFYNRFRYYDPDRADYISQDPLRLAGSLRPCQYTDDPLILPDPFGLMPMAIPVKQGHHMVPHSLATATGASPFNSQYGVPSYYFAPNSPANAHDLMHGYPAGLTPPATKIAQYESQGLTRAKWMAQLEKHYKDPAIQHLRGDLCIVTSTGRGQVIAKNVSPAEAWKATKKWERDQKKKKKSGDC